MGEVIGFGGQGRLTSGGMRKTPRVVLLFAKASPEDISSSLTEVAEEFQLANTDPMQWFFPTVDDWRVFASFDERLFSQYRGAKRELTRAAVGKSPAAVLAITLHSRLLAQACDAATILVTHLLGKFYGIADECCGKDPLWYLEQIRDTKRGVRFLDCYRDPPFETRNR